MGKTVLIFYLIFNALNVFTVSSQNVNDGNILTTSVEMQEAFKFSNIVRLKIENYIYEALPSEARADGNEILQNVTKGLESCESLAKISHTIEQYKVCSSSLFEDGMAALGALQKKYRSSAATASRMSLFYCIAFIYIYIT